jgi:hypothetical protein
MLFIYTTLVLRYHAANPNLTADEAKERALIAIPRAEQPVAPTSGKPAPPVRKYNLQRCKEIAQVSRYAAGVASVERNIPDDPGSVQHNVNMLNEAKLICCSKGISDKYAYLGCARYANGESNSLARGIQEVIDAQLLRKQLGE